MKDLKSVLADFQFSDEDKYLSREFQRYGVHLAETLGDHKHIPLYIKLAKNTPRQILDDALSFVLDANARSKARLFMWKVKQLKAIKLPNAG